MYSLQVDGANVSRLTAGSAGSPILNSFSGKRVVWMLALATINNSTVQTTTARPFTSALRCLQI